MKIISSHHRHQLEFGCLEGKISYSVHLVHWIIISFLMNNWQWFLQILDTERNMLLCFLLITTVTTIIATTLLYYLVEKPFIRLAKNTLKYVE